MIAKTAPPTTGNSVPNSSLGIAIARHNNRPFNRSEAFVGFGDDRCNCWHGEA